VTGSEELARIVDDFQQIVAIETALHGIQHWMHEYEADYRGGMFTAERANWYYGALLLHADIAFTSERKGDQQPGAVLRALRDLGQSELVRLLTTELDAPATKNGQTLGAIIGRIRNEMLVHMSYRIEADFGSTLIFAGPSDDPMFAQSFGRLLDAVGEVLRQLHDIKLDINEHFPGTTPQWIELMNSAPERARAKARDIRSAESRLAKRKRSSKSKYRSRGADGDNPYGR
jgi:hypothetical protein